jgi:hypothetical protein
MGMEIILYTRNCALQELVKLNVFLLLRLSTPTSDFNIIYSLCNFFIGKYCLVGAMSIVYVNYSLDWALVLCYMHFICSANALVHLFSTGPGIA